MSPCFYRIRLQRFGVNMFTATKQLFVFRACKTHSRSKITSNKKCYIINFCQVFSELFLTFGLLVMDWIWMAYTTLKQGVILSLQLRKCNLNFQLRALKASSVRGIIIYHYISVLHIIHVAQYLLQFRQVPSCLQTSRVIEIF